MSFAEIQARCRDLKAQLDAGALSEEDFKTRLQELMTQDDQGRWWIIGYETGQWYVHDGEKWAQAEPPGLSAPSKPPEGPVSATAETTPAAVPEDRSSRVSAVLLPAAAGRRWVSVLIIALGWAAGLAAAELMIKFDSELLSRAFGLAGLVGGAATAFQCYREERALRWYQVLLLAGTPAIGTMLIGLAIADNSDALPVLQTVVIVCLSIGLLIGLILRWANSAVRWGQIGLIAAAWALGGGIGFVVYYLLVESASDISAEVQFAVWGLILGALGGWATLDQLARARRAAAQAVAQQEKRG